MSTDLTPMEIDEIKAEEWRPIDGHPTYWISNMGRIKREQHVRRTKHGSRTVGEAILKQVVSNKGYKRIGLRKDGRNMHLQVHRLVGFAFIPNPDSLPQINHLNSNPSDNRVENLEWCTNKRNQDHIMENDRRKAAIKLHLVDCSTNTVIRSFRSVDEAARELNVSANILLPKVKKGLSWNGFLLKPIEDKRIYTDSELKYKEILQKYLPNKITFDGYIFGGMHVNGLLLAIDEIVHTALNTYNKTQ